MKAQVLVGIRKIETRQIESPVIRNDTDVLLKVDMVGVCGSDVHYYQTGRIGSQVVEYPFVVGHECSATVIKTGAKVTGLKPGDKVAVEPAVVCHKCDQCLSGRENTCRNLKFLGCPGQLAGCLCEYIVMPQGCCFPIGGLISRLQAVLCEPLAIGVYAVQQAQMPAGAKIAILGAGPIGLSCLVAAKAKGIDRICITDKIDARVNAAKDAGALWAGNPDREDVVGKIYQHEPAGVNTVYECAGEQDTIDQAIELLRPGGRLMLIGIPRTERICFVIDKVRRKEITIINVRRQNNCTQKAIDLVAAGRGNVDFMITHRFSFDHTAEAFELVSDYRDGVIKALIEF